MHQNIQLDLHQFYQKQTIIELHDASTESHYSSANSHYSSTDSTTSTYTVSSDSTESQKSFKSKGHKPFKSAPRTHYKPRGKKSFKTAPPKTHYKSTTRTHGRSKTASRGRARQLKLTPDQNKVADVFGKRIMNNNNIQLKYVTSPIGKDAICCAVYYILADSTTAYGSQILNSNTADAIIYKLENYAYALNPVPRKQYRIQNIWDLCNIGIKDVLNLYKFD